MKYDALADAYDDLYADEQEAKFRSTLELVQLRRGDIVLDLGCGTGLLFRHLERSVSAILAVDISRSLLKRALHKSLGSQKISLICADADRLPFLDGVFDKVFAVTILQNMPDVDATLREIIRVAKAEEPLILTGLKRSFTEEQFSMLLNGASLEVLDITADSQSREFVVLCRKKNGYK